MKIKKKNDNSLYLSYIKEYKKIIENILYEKCYDIIEFIDENIIKKAIFQEYGTEGKVLFYKMLGDYHKYLSECDSFKAKEMNQAKLYYNKAIELSKNLQIINPTRLELNLNYSEFLYEILNEKGKAIELAKLIIGKFEKEKGNLDEEDDNATDAISIINLMKENKEYWESELE